MGLESRSCPFVDRNLIEPMDESQWVVSTPGGSFVWSAEGCKNFVRRMKSRQMPPLDAVMALFATPPEVLHDD
jgi:hypothetical protein